MDAEVSQDPFAYYAALRAQAPVLRHPASGLFFVSRMREVNEVLRQPELFSSRVNPPGRLEIDDATREELLRIRAEGWPPTDTLLSADPPLQTRFRKAVGKAFSTRRIEALEPEVRGIARELLASWPEQGRVDVMRGLAVPLPVRVISRLLSIPGEREHDVKRWSDDAVAAIGTVLGRERVLEMARSIVALQRFFAEALEARKREPSDDLLSAMVSLDFEEPGGVTRPLRMAEMLSILQQLMVAGNETTTKAINELVRLLIQHPDEWQRCVREPARIPAVVEEVLRLATPNQGLFRVATRDCELAGVAIPKGARLWVLFGSANRDERVFEEPDRFDPDRPNLNESVVFGRGAHFCLGAPLARLELRVLLDELTQRVERMALPPGFELRYEPSYVLRGLAALEIDVRMRAASPG